ncbi:DnaJ C-terminal domain-containing protein [Miltoncostaea oceani]|uniref:DnaJ C-terminal domain-containing protein n=1 Tax=Miltoncostaea oceani TaxID=2843216 RepID=UPI001C3C2553|nr:DnaJ C-terminal domain-containing protein [Miltoncostaea oceani]
MTGADPYAILQVPVGTDDATIKKSYRRLAREFHPDHNPGDETAVARFREVAAAFELIKDAPARARYASATTAPGPAAGRASRSGVDWTEMFNETSEGGPPERGRDLEIAVEVSFAQAFAGSQVEVQASVEVNCGVCGGTGAAPGASVRRCHVCKGEQFIRVGRINTVCEACAGQGRIIETRCESCHQGRILERRTQRIAIPAGVADGQQLVVAGAGESGAQSPGDLLVAVSVAPSPTFERLEGADLLIEIPVSYPEACLGAKIRIPTPERPILLSLPPGSGSGALLRVRGRGMPLVDDPGTRGDLYARIVIDVPVKLSSAERRLVTQLASHGRKDLRASLFEPEVAGA